MNSGGLPHDGGSGSAGNAMGGNANGFHQPHNAYGNGSFQGRQTFLDVLVRTARCSADPPRRPVFTYSESDANEAHPLSDSVLIPNIAIFLNASSPSCPSSHAPGSLTRSTAASIAPTRSSAPC